MAKVLRLINIKKEKNTFLNSLCILLGLLRIYLIKYYHTVYNYKRLNKLQKKINRRRFEYLNGQKFL